MSTTFHIVFDFNLEDSTRILPLEAVVELKNSVPHYRVSKICRKGNGHQSEILPDMDIKCLRTGEGYKWVHTDSGKETYLSHAIGKAIEAKVESPEIGEENDNEEEEI